jgi:hypothetical protein
MVSAVGGAVCAEWGSRRMRTSSCLKPVNGPFWRNEGDRDISALCMNMQSWLTVSLWKKRCPSPKKLIEEILESARKPSTPFDSNVWWRRNNNDHAPAGTSK